MKATNEQIAQSIAREREAERRQTMADQKHNADMMDAYEVRSDIPTAPWRGPQQRGRNSKTGY